MNAITTRIIFVLGILTIGGNLFGQSGPDEVIAQHYGVSEEVKHDPKGAVVVIVMIFFLILFFSYIGLKKRILISKKNNIAGQAIFNARRGDKFWDEKAMHQLAIGLFHDFFHCYDNREFAPLKGKISDHLFQKWVNPNYKGLKIHPDYIPNSIKIRHKKIVFAHDDEDDQKDMFKFYFEVNYDLNENLKSETKELSPYILSKTLKLFFVFYRRENNWILYEIEEEITKFDIRKL